MRTYWKRIILTGTILLLTACGAPPPAPATPLAATPTALPTVNQPATAPAAAATTLPTAAAPDTPAGEATIDEAGVLDGAYDLGQPVFTDIYVSPSGDDSQDGATPETALRTLTAAWNQIPTGQPLTGTGWRINLLPGEYPCEPAEPDNCQNYFGGRWGTAQFPIQIRALEGPGTVTLRGGLDLFDVAFLYLTDLTLTGGTPLPTNISGNNLLHLSQGDHVLLRGLTLQGPACDNDSCNNLQEVLKVNQAQHLYVENSQISGAWHSAVDYFAVQGGHFLNNRVHTAGQWCMYVKGGSAYLQVAGNDFGPCQLGFQTGQSSNLAVMQAPWLHYEAYGIQVVNNVFHDLPGVPLSVSGGYNVLFAHNTLFQVATAAEPGYPLVQLVHGERGCTATDELPDPVPACQERIAQGGWGPGGLLANLATIPNRNIYIYNNLVLNPAPQQTRYTHFNIAPSLERPAGFENLPNQIPADENVILAGNLIWNGSPEHPLGLDGGTGCPPGHPTCSPEQINAQNQINQLQPALADPAGGDYHPTSTDGLNGQPIPEFTWEAFTPEVPAWPQSNQITTDREGNPRGEQIIPGAYLPR